MGIYNAAYFVKEQRKNAGTAKQINDIRWSLIRQYCPKATSILDYGCGCGYLTAFAPIGTSVDSFDIGIYYNIPYPQTGIQRERYDVICLFDVMEHVDWDNSPDIQMKNMIKASDFVFITVPIFTGDDITKWKHYRPGEHLYYFTEESLIMLLNSYGFSLVYKGYEECPPRIDIITFIFRKA